ncbi:MAG: chemotaxis protein CheW [Pirellulales bacterium]|nr:chemotaxis protein CheW [Pirellulales bacterium]
MSSLGNILLDKEILLESGTNELELLVFNVSDYTFGINVAKVREVLPTAEITALPRAHHSIRGVFRLRDNVIPVVSLLKHLGIQSQGEHAESNMILTDFNQQQTAFLVDDVERIHRLSWENILSVPGLTALSHTPVTALARCDDRLIVMLDFEMILDEVTEQYFRTDFVDNPLGLPREELRLLLAEDSPTVREAIGNTLRASGYTRLQFFENGAEAWEWMERTLGETGRVEDVGDLVISDVEMPQVDGFHLTKRIKGHAQLKRLPVLLYSSIVTPDNRKKGNSVGADAQVSKPELAEVVRLADELISTAQRENRAAALREVTSEIAPQAQAAPAAPRPCPLPADEPIETEEPGGEAVQQRPEPQGDVPCPRGIDPRLWHTFQHELIGRAADLRGQLDRWRAGDRSEERLRVVARILHTIKSASMVVPLDPVTRCTHLVESRMEAARNDLDRWPEQVLDRYLGWLDTLLAPPDDVETALAFSRQLEAELAQSTR